MHKNGMYPDNDNHVLIGNVRILSLFMEAHIKDLYLDLSGTYQQYI